mgnify:CR=1 FL=1
MRGRETSLSRTGFPADGRLVFLCFFEVERLHAVKMPECMGCYGCYGRSVMDGAL